MVQTNLLELTMDDEEIVKIIKKLNCYSTFIVAITTLNKHVVDVREARLFVE